MLQQENHNLTTKTLGAFLATHYPLVAVLLGSFLFAAPMGTYTNWDARLEFEAASSILTRGFPYVTGGLLINQPPLGFYTAAPVLAASGLDYISAVGLATVFGLGGVAMVYALGTLLYGRRTGRAASALFGLVPWHVYMSRIFLIDNQYLFLSLLFVVIGVLAIRKNSDKLVLVAGAVFALALLTKLFAVFALIPIALLIYLNRKESSFKLNRKKLLLFLLPVIATQAVWFGVFANQNFLGVYFPTDFSHPELIADPSLLFQPIIFVKSAGWLLFGAVLFSVGLAAAYRRQLKQLLRLDVVCLGTVAVILALDMFLAACLHLTVPYVSAVKYNYFALPFLCLLAASVADKGGLLIQSANSSKKARLAIALAAVGAALVFASMLENLLFLNTWTGFVSFGVDSVTYYGFDVFSAPADFNWVTPLHYLGLIFTVGAFFLPHMVSKLKHSIVMLHRILTN